MAIGHISVRVHTRSQGHSAAAALAYRMGVDLVDSRTGVEHAYGRRVKRGEVLASGMEGGGAFADVGALAAAIEAAERRKNSALLRDVQVALPCELGEEEGSALLREFARMLAERYATHVAWSMHRADKRGDERNRHGHMVLPTRALGEDGQFGKKLRVLDDRTSGPGEVKALRRLWEGTANTYLETEDVAARVDVGRREEGAPMPTLGAACTALEREEVAELGEVLEGQSVAALVTEGAPVTWRGRALKRHQEAVQREEKERAHRAEEPRDQAEESLAHIPCAEVQPAAVSQPVWIDWRREVPLRRSVVSEVHVAQAETPAAITPRRGMAAPVRAVDVHEARPEPTVRPAVVVLRREPPAAAPRAVIVRPVDVKPAVRPARGVRVRPAARPRRSVAVHPVEVRAVARPAPVGMDRLAELQRREEELRRDRAVAVRVVELTRRRVEIEAAAGGGELLRRVEGRRGAPRNLAQREELIEHVDQVLLAADEAEAQLPTSPDPKRPRRRVSAVIDAMLDAVPADDDDPVVGDVVFLLGARYAQRTQEGVAEGGYAAAAREESARRHFGSAVVDAMQWCVLKVREIILAACHKILGGGGESGKRVQASLEAAGAECQAQQSAVESAAQSVAIDVGVFARSALGDGRDPVSVLEEETAKRRQVLSNAAAFGVDIQAELKAGGFAAIEVATEQWQDAISTAKDLRIQVDAVTAAARSTGKDPLEALKKETAWAKTVRSYAAAIGLPRRKFEAVFEEAETRRLNSGYTAVWEECVRTMARKEVRKVLPFEGPDRGRPGALVPAISDAWSRELLREIQDDAVAQDILREVLAEPAGSDEERATAEGFYHQRQTRIEHEKQKREHKRWLSSKPTEKEARQVVLARFIPVLAERVRQACAQVQDLDGLTARMVEEDRARRVKGALEKTLPQETPSGYGSPSIAVSDERFSWIAEQTSNASVQEIISTTYLEGLNINDYGRAQAEEIHLRRRIREKEESGLRRDQAEATARKEYAVEVQHQIERIFREIESRTAEEILRERARRDGMPAARQAYGVDRTDEHGRKHTDRSEGWR